MPDQTADDLARILSLATSRNSTSDVVAAGPAMGPSASPDVPDAEVKYGGGKFEMLPEHITPEFFDFGETADEDAGATFGGRPRFDSKVRGAGCTT